MGERERRKEREREERGREGGERREVDNWTYAHS